MGTAIIILTIVSIATGAAATALKAIEDVKKD